MSLAKSSHSDPDEEPFYFMDVVEESSATQTKPRSALISHMDKTRIIKAHLAGKHPKVIAEIMDIAQRRIEVVIRSYAKTGRIRGTSNRSLATQKPSTPTRHSLTAPQVDMLRQWTSEDATQTGAQLAKRLNDAYNASFSVQLVQRHLGPFLFSLSRISDQSEQARNDEETLNLRREFCQIYSDLPAMYDDSEVVYVGHTRFRLAVRDRAECRQEKTRSRLRLRNISVCVAINRHQLIGYIAQNPPIEQEQFQEMLETVLDAQKERGFASGVVVMDEACARENVDAVAQLVAARDYTSLFLPPCSAFLNPVEALFGEFRELLSALKTEVASETEVVEVILGGTQLIDVMDCRRYWDSVQSFVPRCLNLEPIEIVNLNTVYAEEEDVAAMADREEMVEETFDY